MVAENQRGAHAECLTNAGKFVENVLIAIEYVRSKKTLKEIKNVSEIVKAFASDASLPDSLRVIIPRVAQGIYEVRSKRGAVHVKEIDPRQIDAALSVQTASWILAELIRLYHVDSEASVAEAMTVILRAEMPLIETLGGEVVVTTKVPVGVEILLLVARSGALGCDRRALGSASKFAPPRVTDALKKLQQDLFVHKAADGQFHITAPGERWLSVALEKFTKQRFHSEAA